MRRPAMAPFAQCALHPICSEVREASQPSQQTPLSRYFGVGSVSQHPPEAGANATSLVEREDPQALALGSVSS
ncbi:hypothetical protein LZ32DRAFT_609091 [Colletotrichum eremochloae]|nr:hypothetical protein LZ32DRAFT_609091 [Colletotrichum eremochloae]